MQIHSFLIRGIGVVTYFPLLYPQPLPIRSGMAISSVSFAVSIPYTPGGVFEHLLCLALVSLDLKTGGSICNVVFRFHSAKHHVKAFIWLAGCHHTVLFPPAVIHPTVYITYVGKSSSLLLKYSSRKALGIKYFTPTRMQRSSQLQQIVRFGAVMQYFLYIFRVIKSG